MKNLKCIYEAYIPKILRSKNHLRYNLSDENIFGNLNYSMSQDLLKGKNIKLNYATISKLLGNKSLNNSKPSKLIPIIRITNS